MVVSVTSKVGDITPPMKLTHKKPTFKTTQLRSAQNPLWHPVYRLVNRDAAGCLSCLIRIFIELGSTVPISTTWSGFLSLLNSLIPHNHHVHQSQKLPTYLHHPTIHYITNPNNALLTGNASKLPQICIVWSPQNGWHLMIPASSKTSTSEPPKFAPILPVWDPRPKSNAAFIHPSRPGKFFTASTWSAELLEWW